MQPSTSPTPLSAEPCSPLDGRPPSSTSPAPPPNTIHIESNETSLVEAAEEEGEAEDNQADSGQSTSSSAGSDTPQDLTVDLTVDTTAPSISSVPPSDEEHEPNKQMSVDRSREETDSQSSGFLANGSEQFSLNSAGVSAKASSETVAESTSEDLIKPLEVVVERPEIHGLQFTPSQLTPASDPTTPNSLPSKKLSVISTQSEIEGSPRVLRLLRVHVAHIKGLPKGDRPLLLQARVDSLPSTHTHVLPRTETQAEFEVEVGGRSRAVQLLLAEDERLDRPMCRLKVHMTDVPPHPEFIQRSFFLRKGIQSLLQLTYLHLRRSSRTATKECEPQGRLCVETRRHGNSFLLRVVDYQELALNKDVYAEVAFEGRKEVERLKLTGRRPGTEISWTQLTIPQKVVYTPTIKVSVYQGSLLSGSCFLGELRVTVPDETAHEHSSSCPQWMSLLPRLDSPVDGDVNPSRGVMRIHFSLCCERVLPVTEYEPLYLELVSSLHQSAPFDVSAVQLFEHLPQIDLTSLARPMLKVFVHCKEIRIFLKKLYNVDITKCHAKDVNTLFRSKTMATTILCEYLRIYGHHYLQISLKPLIDQVYREHKRCEIDPARMESGESVDKNTANLKKYMERFHEMVISSAERCPLALREVFSDLRETIESRFPGRLDLQRLALTSFLVMRFFAAAILNPVAFNLRTDSPDSRVSRTLVLLSKVLQRLANSVVAEGRAKLLQKLSPKEAWLQPVLAAFTDEKHRTEMSVFLDKVSLITVSRPSRSTSLPATDRISEGNFGSNLVYYKSQPSVNPLRGLIGKDRRYVCLTDSELIWQKDSNGPHDQRARLSLTDITAVEKGRQRANVFDIRTRHRSVAFEANSESHRDEWIQAIEDARTRDIIARERSIFEVSNVDLPRELERLRNMLRVHMPVLESWRQRIEGAPVPEGATPLPNFIDDEMKMSETDLRECFRETLSRILEILENLDRAHNEYSNEGENE